MYGKQIRLKHDLPGVKAGRVLQVSNTNFRTITFINDNGVDITVEWTDPFWFEEIKKETLEPKVIYTTFAHSANEILITERGMKLLQRGENITDAKENIVVKYKPEAVVGKLDRKRKFDEILKTVKESIGKTDEYLPLFGREVEIIDSYRKAKAVGIKVNKILLVPHGIVCVGDPPVILDETSDGFKGIL